MTAIQIVVTILVFVLLAAALLMAFAYGYEKGVNDLTKEIDEGIKRLKQEQDDNT